MKRDAWTEGFDDVIFALDFPESQVDSPSQPDLLPGGGVHIPDSNLRAVIAEALGKGPNAPITVEEMERLRELYARNRGIQDLTGLQFATNLTELELNGNQISDLSPIAGLIELSRLDLNRNSISDLSPVKGLKNLTFLKLWGDRQLLSDLSPVAGLINLRYLRVTFSSISDLSPVAELINLTYLGVTDNNVTDLSPVAGLINLEELDFGNSPASDLSPLASLINLKFIITWGNPISDLSPLARLPKLEIISFGGAEVSDLKPLAGLAGLEELYFVGNNISDISPLAGLTGLKRLDLWGNNISDISPLAGLTNLTWVNVADNQISDFSPLDGLRESTKIVWHSNPGFPKGGPKIEGPWLWVVLPDTELNSRIDLLAEASGGTVTETAIATHGATEGKSVGEDVWTSHNLPPTGWDNIEDMLKRSIDSSVIYGTVSLYSPREQGTTMYVGGDRGVRVWLNGALIYERFNRQRANNYTDFFPVTLKQGRNVLLVAAHTLGNGFFGFEPGTDYTVSIGVGYAFSQTPIHIGDTFTFNIRAENIADLAGWQFDIAFDPAILEAINVTEGDFLKQNSASTFFQGGSIDNAAGKIAGLNAARLAAQGATGTGSLLQVNFKAKSGGETKLTLQNFQFGSVTGDSIPAGPHEITITVEGRLATGDVNRDGVVTILDLILVAQQLGKRVSADSPVDVNGDGVVTILDLIRVSQAIGNPAAPAVAADDVEAATIAAWIAQAQLEDDGSLAFKQGIKNLENLLASLIPEETALWANYPNPFNPETWIPYQLAESAEVTLTIYDMKREVSSAFGVGAPSSRYVSESQPRSLLGRTKSTR